MALVVFFCLSDFPEEAKWLKPDEKAFVTARLRVDQGHAARESKVTLKKVGGILSEFRVLIAGVMYFGLIVPAYSYAYFSPTIIRGFGYTPIQTQLHSVPPWAAAFGWSMIMATFSDLSRHRFGFIMFGICIAISAFAILISVHNNIQVHAVHGVLVQHEHRKSREKIRLLSVAGRLRQHWRHYRCLCVFPS
jgi:hypothetical protein